MNATMYMIPVNKLVLVKESESIEDILNKMKEGSFKTLPVVDDANRFVGVIHEGKIYETFYYTELNNSDFSKAEIRPLVDRKVGSIQKNTDFLHVILKMEKMDIHFLPITDEEHRFLGIVTRNKIFEAFESAFGYNQEGYLIEVVAIDAKGQLARLAKSIADTEANIVSMIQFDLSIASLERIILKVQTAHIERVLESIADEGFRVTNHRFVPKAEHL